MTEALIFVIVFLGIITQSVTGFGFALVTMPLLIHLLGVQVAAALGAVVAIFSQMYLVFRYREAFDPKAVAPLMAAGVVGIPLGVSALQRIPGDALLTVLGLVVAGYALYALLGLRLPIIQRRVWALGFGFASGLLSGAYNTGGPPLVIYATCRGWPPATFKGNLQALFVANSTVAILAHALNQDYTPLVLRYFLVGLPAVALGLWLGLKLDRRLNPAVFRRLVLVVLLAVGVSLIL